MTSLADKLKDVEVLTVPLWTPRPAILLSANTVKPMHGVVPRILLGREWWDETRKAAYRSTQYHCLACGVHQTEAVEHRWLEGHEVYQTDYAAGIMTYVETVPLCHYCHCYIHDGRLEALVGNGEVTLEKYRAVMRHGRKVLKQAKLRKPDPYKGKMAEWGDWRLFLNGILYPPLYRTYEEWLRAFAPETK